MSATTCSVGNPLGFAKEMFLCVKIHTSPAVDMGFQAVSNQACTIISVAPMTPTMNLQDQ